MIQLIYTSTTRIPFTGIEFSRLLLKSRVNNELAEITGILLYQGNSFMQLLDGEEEAVEATYARVAADPRHGGLQVLRRITIQEPTFPGWSMGFVHLRLGREDEPAGLEEFFSKKGRPGAHAGQHAFDLLREFRYGNWRRHVDRGFAPVVVR